MFFSSLLPIEIWFIIYKIEHSMNHVYVLNEIKQLSNQIKDLNNAITDKTEKWNLIKWNNFKTEFKNKDFYGRCQISSFKYFPDIPKNHSCALCQNI